MASFAPPPPSPPGAPPPAPPAAGAPPPGISGLVNANQATPPGPTPDQKFQAYAEQVRGLHTAIDGLALDHPEAANDLNDAKNALTNSLSKVATNSSGPDTGPAPPSF
jgi:hypothetical protein